MRNWKDEEDDYDYSPNELSRLSQENHEKYKEIVESNLEEGQTLESWHRANMEMAKDFLAHQRLMKK
jgi:hypothetical protein